MSFLIATLCALASGPLLYAVARRRPDLLAFLDGFVVVSIAGLVLLEVVPGAFGEGGAWSIAFLLLGALGPNAVEHLLERARRETHMTVLVLAVGGLILHSLGDGAALTPHHGDHHHGLAIAIAVHSVPVGLAVWWLLRSSFGALLPGLALLAMGAATVLGYRYGIELSQILGQQAWAWFQALVAGSILHVVFGRPHLESASDETEQRPGFEGLGNLCALLALLAFHTLDPHAEWIHGFGERFLDLSLQSAPALLAAYLIGGFVGTQLPDAWLNWLRRGGNGAQALRGTAMGLPLPICSCGVLPVYRSLMMRGAPTAAAIAFLIATPEVGLTALFVSLPLLGWEMTAIRVGAAALLAMMVAWTLARFLPSPIQAQAASVKSCCTSEQAQTNKPWHRIRSALRVGGVELVDGTMAWILIGVAVAALVAPGVQALPWNQWPDGLELLIFAALGLPLYVCAAGATPFVAVLLAGGVSPGAALAFLLTGPATNVATFGVLRAIHGSRFAVAFAVFTALGAIGLGFAVNAFVPSADIAHAAHQHRSGGVLQWSSLMVLAILFAGSLLRRGGRRLVGGLFESAPHDHGHQASQAPA
ncbi:MAG: permease [Panacagrimonas sp.]